MLMKRSLLAILALFALTLAGCGTLDMGGSTSAPSSSAATEQILASGELRVGMSGNQPPFNMKNRAGELIGMDVDLARALARMMGVEATLVTMPFNELLPALQKGEIDIVLSGVTMTTERNLKVAFAGPYFVSGKAALTKEPSLAAADEPADVNKPIRMSVLAGSTSEKFVKERLPEVTLVAVADYSEAVQRVLDDDVDAMIADYPVTLLELYRHPGVGLVSTISTFSFEPIGVALSPDSHLLQNAVQNYFTLLEGTGTLERLRLMWFDNAEWIAELP